MTRAEWSSFSEAEEQARRAAVTRVLRLAGFAMLLLFAVVVENGIVLLVLFMTMPAILLASDRLHLTEEQTARLVDDPSPVPHFPANVVLTDGYTQTGRDAGTIAFVDGWLVYTGLRTSFSLRACDVEPITVTVPVVPNPLIEARNRIGRSLVVPGRDSAGTRELSELDFWPFYLLSGHVGFRLKNGPPDGMHLLYRVWGSASFSFALHRWLKTPSSFEDQPVLPPQGVLPEAMRDAGNRVAIASLFAVATGISFARTVLDQGWGFPWLALGWGAYFALALAVVWGCAANYRRIIGLSRRSPS